MVLTGQIIVLIILGAFLLGTIPGSFKRRIGVLLLALVFFAVFFATPAGAEVLNWLNGLKELLGETPTVDTVG